MTNAEEDAIVVYVRDASVIRSIPRTFDGYDVQPEITGDITAL